MPQSVWLTEVGKTRLEEELLDLRSRRRPELHERIQEATESGDVSDNAEYEELKDEWAMLEARIRELEQTLDRAVIVEKPSEDGLIGLGSEVTLRADDGEVETWVLVSPEEAKSGDGRISTQSPVGQALMGCRVGESATVTAPGGAMRYTVVKVA
jgi:transcription elongation factor GreA